MTETGELNTFGLSNDGTNDHQVKMSLAIKSHHHIFARMWSTVSPAERLVVLHKGRICCAHKGLKTGGEEKALLEALSIERAQLNKVLYLSPNLKVTRTGLSVKAKQLSWTSPEIVNKVGTIKTMGWHEGTG